MRMASTTATLRDVITSEARCEPPRSPSCRNRRRSFLDTGRPHRGAGSYYLKPRSGSTARLPLRSFPGLAGRILTSPIEAPCGKSSPYQSSVPLPILPLRGGASPAIVSGSRHTMAPKFTDRSAPGRLARMSLLFPQDRRRSRDPFDGLKVRRCFSCPGFQ